MPYRDLRDYIAELDKRDLLQVVDAPVCKDTELVPLVRLQFRGLPEAERRAFWFKQVTDQRGRNFDASVVLGSLGCSRAVYAAALGVEADGTGARWAELGFPALNLSDPWYGYPLSDWTEENADEAEKAVNGRKFETGEKLVQRRKPTSN